MMMTQTNILNTQPINPLALGKRVAIGAAIGLAVIGVFLLGVKHPRPEWGALWMVKPLIMVPLAGAGGGLYYYMMNHFLGSQGGWKKAVAMLLSIIGFIIALWLGTVLGLNGTMWH